MTPGSDIRIPYVSLAGNSWADYRDFLGQVRIDAGENLLLVRGSVPGPKNGYVEVRTYG